MHVVPHVPVRPFRFGIQGRPCGDGEQRGLKTLPRVFHLAEFRLEIGRRSRQCVPQILAAVLEDMENAIEGTDEISNSCPRFVAPVVHRLGMGEELLRQHALAAGEIDDRHVDRGLPQPVKHDCKGQEHTNERKQPQQADPGGDCEHRRPATIDDAGSARRRLLSRTNSIHRFPPATGLRARACLRHSALTRCCLI
jgi:hypothetical protein